MSRIIAWASILVVLAALLLPSPTLASAPWWDSDWKYRKRLIFDNSAATSDLTNFPVLIVLNSTRIDYNKAQGNGEDIRFIDADGVTILKHEIEDWNTAGTSWVWVEVPTIGAASSTDYIWMYYGNDAVADGQDVSAVWSSGAAAVHHLRDDPDTSHVADSTVYNRDGTKLAANEPAEAVGLVYLAQDADGVNDKITVTDTASLDFADDPFSVSFWVNTAAAIGGNSYQYPVYKGGDGNLNPGYTFYIREANADIVFSISDGDNVATPSYDTVASTGASADVRTSAWRHIVGVRDGLGSLYIYLDGALNNSAASDEANINSASALYLSSRNGANPLNGLLDETRIYNRALTASEIGAFFLSETNTFVTFEDEERGDATMLLIGLILLALTLTSVGYIKQQSLLTFAAAGAWVLLGVYAYAQSATPGGGAWDVYYALFFLSAGLALVSALLPAVQRPSKAEEKGDVLLSDIDRFEEEHDKLVAQTRIPRIGHKGYSDRRRERAVRKGDR